MSCEELKERYNKLQNEIKKLEKEIEDCEIQEKLKSNKFLKVKCPNCHGRGFLDNQGLYIQCTFCDGKGWIVAEKWEGD